MASILTVDEQSKEKKREVLRGGERDGDGGRMTDGKKGLKVKEWDVMNSEENTMTGIQHVQISINQQTI